MGGDGSGRRNCSKETTAAYLQLDVRWLHRNGYLIPGRIGSVQWSRRGEPFASINVRAVQDRVILSYSHRADGEERTNEQYPVRIEQTRCNYGGTRVWFVCPARGCSRRVAVLYGGRIFACRHCHKLAYDSQRESSYLRALHKAQAIRMRLGGSASMYDPFPPKPKGMHYQTYERLRMKGEAADRRSWPPSLLRLFHR